MTKKEWLGRYGVLLLDIERTEAEIQRWRAKAESITQHITDMPKGGHWKNPLEDAVCAIYELEQELDGRILESLAVRKEIEDAIDAVENPVYRELLKRRYMDGDKWHKISKQMGYDIDHVRKYLHSKALNIIKLPGFTR